MSCIVALQRNFRRWININLLLAMAVFLPGCGESITRPPTLARSAAIVEDQQSVTNSDQYFASRGATGTNDPLSLEPQYLSIQPLSPEAKANRAQLAEEVASPIANLASLALRFTYAKGLGPKSGYNVNLLVQPLIPISLNKDWNLIVQTSVPVNEVSSIANGIDSRFGLGDTLQSFYLVPDEPGRRGWIFGIGPDFLWPTATNDGLGSGKWGAGPTGAVVRQYHSWTYGIVANQIWSFAGDDERKNVNLTLLHPLVTYTFPTATGITLESDSTYDWMASQWTVPVQLSLSQVVVRGRRPVQIALGGRYYAQRPVGAPDWGVRLSMTFLFPN
jgi:hypothetical protein